MARKFLYVIAFLIVLVIAGLGALNIWSKELTEFTFVPRGQFVKQQALAANAYADPAMWYSRPGMAAANDPSRWRPPAAIENAEGAAPRRPAATPAIAPTQAAMGKPKTTPYAVFFVHPTSYLPIAFSGDAQWNAALGDVQAEDRARLFLRGLASPFSSAREIWAPKYRQAVFGAFLTDKPEGQQAIDAAYRDIEQAFDVFVASIDKDEPIVLAGHSQGALHILRLLREKVNGTPLRQRIAMVYPVGWPISVQHDLPEEGLPACANADQGGCIASWVSFAEPADPSQLMARYQASPGFDGQPRGNGPILCVNPITGMLNGAAPAHDNRGTLVPSADFSTGRLVAGAVPARCDAHGLLLIGDPPEMGSAVLPGNNYHVYDIPLFWRNLQSDVVRRVAAWSKSR